MNPIYFNLFLYLIPLIFFLLKCKTVNMLNLLWIEYTFFAFFSIIVWNTGVYKLTSGIFIKNELTYLPFIFVFIILSILFIPVYFFKENDIETIIMPSKDKLKLVMYPAIILGVFLSISMFSYLSIDIIYNFGEIYKTGKATNIGIFPHYIELLFTGYSIFYLILILLFYYYSTFERNKKLLIIALAVASFVPNILYGIGGASRGTLFFRFLDFIAVFFLFKKHMSSKLKFRVIQLSIILLAVLLLATIYLHVRVCRLFHCTTALHSLRLLFLYIP